MSLCLQPIYIASRLYNTSNEVSIESQLGNDMYHYPTIWDESPSPNRPGTYKVFSTYADLFQYITTIFRNNDKMGFPRPNFHEVIFGRCPQRLKFDIDADGKKKELIDNYNIKDKLPTYYHDCVPKEDAIIQYIRDVIFMTFVENYGKGITANNIINKEKMMFVAESHAPGKKYSFHIIVCKFKVQTSEEAKWFMKKVLKKIADFDPALCDLFDEQIYSATRCFRILGCGKKSDPSRIKKTSDTNMNRRQNQGWCTYGLIQHNSYGDDIIIQSINYNDISPLYQLTSRDGYVMSRDTENKCKEHLKKLYPEFQYKITKGNMLEYTRISSSYCNVCNRMHDQEHAYAYISGGELLWNCRRNIKKERIKSIMAIENASYDKIKELRRLKQEIIDTPLAELDPLRIYEDRFPGKWNKSASKDLQDFPEIYDTLYVKAPMKMGKSKKLIKHIRKIHKDVTPIQSILFVSFRRAFTGEMISKFNTGDKRTGLDKEFDKKLIDYRDIKGNERRITADIYPFVIVQVESFHRVQSKYDMVVLDESESIYEQFSSSNIKNLSLIINNFSRVMKKAQRVICMDAYMGERTVDITNRLRGEIIRDNITRKKRDVVTKFCINTFQNQGNKSDGLYTYNIGYCINNFYNNIVKALREGKKIVILSNSRDKLNAIGNLIEQDFPKVNKQLYTALSKEYEKNDLKDVNKSWLQYQVVMYSPTITAGVSFEEKHFDKVFCLFTNKSCNVLSCIQMIGRIRDVGDKDITIYYEDHYTVGSITKEGIIDDLIANRNELLSIAYSGRYDDDDDDDDDDDQYFKYKPIEDDYYHIWLHNQLADNLSSKFFLRLLIYCIHLTGAQINIYDNIGGEIGKRMKDAVDDIKEERYQEIADSRSISSDEYVELVNKEKDEYIDYTDKLSKEKYFLGHLYHPPDRDTYFNTITYVRYYYPENIRDIYINLKDILTTGTTSIYEAIEDLSYNEAHCVSLHLHNKDSVADLNHRTKANLHRSCHDLLQIIGFVDIVDAHVIVDKRNLSTKRIDYNKVIQNIRKSLNFFNTLQLLLKNLAERPAKYSKEHKHLPKEDQYIKMCLEGFNRALSKFYGYHIIHTYQKDAWLLERKDFHQFEVPYDEASMKKLNDEGSKLIRIPTNLRGRGLLLDDKKFDWDLESDISEEL